MKGTPGISLLAVCAALASAPPASAHQQAPQELPPAPDNLPQPEEGQGTTDAAFNNAQAEAATSPDADTTGSEVVVTGFRGSLNSALALKKREVAVVDSILAEDVGKFPDANLAESMQRVPGVALQRGDGGEGRRITVRGLPPLFTRVLVGGMEANSQVAQSDINNIGGGSSRSRAFDFSAYPSEIFSSLTVRKSVSPETQEGSLGATVELRAPRPFDYNDDFVLSASAKATYSDLRDRVGPRIAGLVSKKFADDTLGILVGAAWTKRQTRDEGYAPSNVVASNADQGFCSPVGVTPQNPVDSVRNGTDALNCSGSVPRTGNPDAYNLINSPNVFHPRLPRYERSDQNYTRLGVTGSLQWHPTERTDVVLDGIYTKYDVKRQDFYLMNLSFGRGVTARGKPDVSVVEAEVDPLGSLVYGVFNGVDVASQVYQNNYTTDLKQGTLNFKHEFSDRFQLYGQLGLNESRLREPLRVNVISYANNVDGFTFDVRDSDFALIDFGFDITDPNNFVYAPNTAADGTITSQATANRGGSTSRSKLGELNALWSPLDWLKLRIGGQARRNSFVAFNEARNANINPALPAGVTLASISRTIDGFGKGLRDGLPAGWSGIDWAKFATTFDFFNNPSFAFFGPEDGQALGDNYAVRETVKGGYAQVEIDRDVGPVRVRGNAGVRYVRTDQRSFGYVSGVGVVPVTIDRHYDDWLPSMNLAVDVTNQLTFRVAAAKVLARPDLPELSPGTSIQPNTRTASVGNPFLEPTRAKTLDIAAEWYFQPGSLLAVSYFYKDIDSYTQAITRSIPFSETGFPSSLLAGQPVGPEDIFVISSRLNTPGGPLRGVEINYQQQFSFLPSFLKNVGLLANYTRVTSDINYILNQATGVTAEFPLVGLSKNQANATLYYEDSKFSIRSSINYRSSSLRQVPSGSSSPGSDVDLIAPTTFVDASASYSLTDQIRLTLEASNLTDEHTIYYVDSRRKDVLYNVHSGRTFTVGVSFKL
jgi:TonB-dependent receptor